MHADELDNYLRTLLFFFSIENLGKKSTQLVGFPYGKLPVKKSCFFYHGDR